MDDTCKLRMNLAAIKKVDPYANDIVDKSPHVAFYTFNSDKNEWEKTDVEGAFFVYSRNGQPFNSIFINNRLNTTSFVEPVTGQLELQSQPPFLLYRNERSRIRGFWFYNSEECDRIAKVLKIIVEQQAASNGANGGGGGGSGSEENILKPSENENMNMTPVNNGNGSGRLLSESSSSTNVPLNNNNANATNNLMNVLNKVSVKEENKKEVPFQKQDSVNIFNMLSKAQQEYANSQNSTISTNNFPPGLSAFPNPSITNQIQQPQHPNPMPSGSVMEFFAAAKPKISNDNVAGNAPILPLSVEEIERQHRTQTPVASNITNATPTTLGQPSVASAFIKQMNTTPIIQNLQASDKLILANIRQQQQQQQQMPSPPLPPLSESDAAKFQTFVNRANVFLANNTVTANTVEEIENQLRNLLDKDTKTPNETTPSTRTASGITSSASAATPIAAATPAQIPSFPLTLSQESSSVLSLLNSKDYLTNHKPALMPPTMFECSSSSSATTPAINSIPLTEPLSRPINLQDLLNPSQLAQALIYLMQNDQDFVQKLHEAYLKVSTKSLVDTFH